MRTRRRLDVTGVVQGVGFRPFVHRLAEDLDLGGFVHNGPDHVRIEIEGALPAVTRFANRLRDEPPPLASIDRVVTVDLASRGEYRFHIVESSNDGDGPMIRLVPPDVATCEDCRAELFDPSDRRFRHPFITCTSCGPRFTIITSLPYDRPGTTMAGFAMCPACAGEYDDPTDRRFHAQPVACPACGPRLRHDDGQVTFGTDAVITAVLRDLGRGRIVAVKGLGGYHLAVDATDDGAVARLRHRKQRPHKPFAVMVPDLETARAIARVSAAEAGALRSPERPIVLLHARAGSSLSAELAPGNALVGVMLPSTPVHHLLFQPVPGSTTVGPEVLVMTSGNRSEEPICYDDEDARDRLGAIADSFCDHDRPIHLPCDDSVVRLIAGVVTPLRRSRGYAPLPVALPLDVEPMLAVGGDLKNAFCLARGRHAWISQHLGDMENLETLEAFERSVENLQRFQAIEPELVAVDAHPLYRTRRWALGRGAGLSVVSVQHHHAHLAALMAEHGMAGHEPLLGFVFDGTGHGADGDLWGGELLIGDYSSCERLGTLAPIALPGGDAAVLNPCRSALAHLEAAGIAWSPDLAPVAASTDIERAVLRAQLAAHRGRPRTSSMGRLFDAVASLLGLRHRVTYEAQAAIELECLAGAASEPAVGIAFAVDDGVMQPGPLLRGLVDGLAEGRDRATLALAFHHAVVEAIALMVHHVRSERPVDRVGLTGGVFQNALLAELAVAQLSEEGIEVLTHRLVPPNDGGLSLGQAVVAAQVGSENAGGGPRRCV